MILPAEPKLAVKKLEGLVDNLMSRADQLQTTTVSER